MLGGDGKAKERKQCSRIFPLPIVFRALSIFRDAKTPNMGKLLYKKEKRKSVKQLFYGRLCIK